MSDIKFTGFEYVSFGLREYNKGLYVVIRLIDNDSNVVERSISIFNFDILVHEIQEETRLAAVKERSK